MTCRAVVAAIRPKSSGVSSHSPAAPSAGLLRQHPDVPGLAVDVHARVRLVALGVPVGREQRGLDRLEHGLERDVLVPFDRAQRSDSTFTSRSSATSCPDPSSSSPGSSAASSSTAPGSSSATLFSGAGRIPPRRLRARRRRSGLRAAGRRPAWSPPPLPPRRPVRRTGVAHAEPGADRLTSRRRARRQCRGTVSGRSTPGEVTSSDVHPPTRCSCCSSSSAAARASRRCRPARPGVEVHRPSGPCDAGPRAHIQRVQLESGPGDHGLQHAAQFVRRRPGADPGLRRTILPRTILRRTIRAGSGRCAPGPGARRGHRRHSWSVRAAGSPSWAVRAGGCGRLRELPNRASGSARVSRRVRRAAWQDEPP